MFVSKMALAATSSLILLSIPIALSLAATGLFSGESVMATCYAALGGSLILGVLMVTTAAGRLLRKIEG